MRSRKLSSGCLSLAVIIGACGGNPPSATAPTGGDTTPLAPPGANTTQPFPIDRGDDGPTTPGTYKGLWLRLATNASPTVTPVGGVIAFVCIGMSNANQECADFAGRLTTEYVAQVNPAVRFLNCGVGGNAIERWNDPANDATLWDACLSRLQQLGLRADQVRVIYHKAANQFTTGSGNTPLPLYPAAGSDYENFVRNLGVFATRVKTKFPAVQAVYTSSRSYGGWGGVSRGEPLSYEEGHALNSWLAANRSVGDVWYGWGAYLWAPACATGVSNKGGVCYDREDYVSDGVHPSSSGTAKISRLMHERFLKESWYRR